MARDARRYLLLRRRPDDPRTAADAGAHFRSGAVRTRRCPEEPELLALSRGDGRGAAAPGKDEGGATGAACGREAETGSGALRETTGASAPRRGVGRRGGEA